MKIVWVLVLLSFLTISLYPKMPDTMASHWDSLGNVNGYLPKLWGLLIIPLMTLVLAGLFTILPKIDPLKGIDSFRTHYDRFALYVVAFLLCVQLLIVAWNTGMAFNMTQLIAPGLGVLLYQTGIVMKNSKRNWFVGIRTPWTISSDEVWIKTHKLGSRIFKALGLASLVIIISPNYILPFILLIVGAALFLVAYSYTNFINIQGAHNSNGK